MGYMRDIEGVRLDTISLRRFVEYEGWSVISTNPAKYGGFQSSSTESSMGARTECVPPLDVRAIKLGYGNWGTGLGGELPNTNPITIRASLQPLGASINEGVGDPAYQVTFGGLDTFVLGRGKFALSDPIKLGVLAGTRFFIKTYVNGNCPAAPSAPTVTFNTGTGSQFALGNVVGVSITQVFPGGVESAASPITSVTCGTAGNNIIVTSPSNPANGSIGYRVWVTQRGLSTPCYDSACGVLPYGTGATVSGLLGTGNTINGNISSNSEAGVEQVDPSGATYFPIGGSVLGGTTPGSANTGEAYTINGPQFLGDRTGEAIRVATAGLTAAVNVYAPIVVLGKSGKTIWRSCATIGDSISNGTADYGFGATLGGFQKRTVMGQLAQPAYDATRTPTMGHVWLGQGAETALQFASTAGFKRSQVASHCTSVWSNYGTNDKTLGVAPLINSIAAIAARFTTQGKPFLQSDVIPNTTSTDGWSTVTNQKWVTSVGEATRLAFNLWLADSTGAATVSNETLFLSPGSGQGPTFNPFGGGDGSTHAFYMAHAFVQGTEVVKVGGVTKAVTTDYTYLLPITIGGVAYASGISISTAPGASVAVTASYTKIPGFVPMCGPLAFYVPVVVAVEVNAAGTAQLGGGWYKPSDAALFGPHSLTGVTSSSITDSAQAWTQDQWRGYSVRIVTDPVTPSAVGGVMGISSNTATLLTGGATWVVTPSTSATYVICKNYTQDGTHPSTFAHLLLANQAVASGVLNMIS